MLRTSDVIAGHPDVTYVFLDLVSLLPFLLAVDSQKLLPVRRDVPLCGRAEENALGDVVEAPLLVRRLPAQVDAPSDVIGVVRKTKNTNKSPKMKT